MKSEFEGCLKRGKIKEFSQGKSLVHKELKTAGNDIKEAIDSLGAEKYKWSTIQAYYSMFHSARALLYNKNYREKSHYCLIIALRVLYAGVKQLPVVLLEALQHAKELREAADYYDEWSKVSAQEMVQNAKEFLKKAKEIIGD